MKNVVFLRKGVAPFENYNAGATGAFDDAVANMLISERYAKEAPAPSTGTKLICFVRSDRIPHHGCYDRGDIAGFAGPIADAIVAQGFGVLHDAGNGPGKVLTSEQAGITHGQEMGETDGMYVARGGKPEGARDPAAVEALIAARAQPKGKIRAALGV